MAIIASISYKLSFQYPFISYIIH